ncbi:abc transporter atp-binding protein : Uncharacterized protein OS=Pirellula staleyi (strain ATCC 27377 / DSM 6068 / ICPB 4128) GN=Psta_2963 PE=4 SV=1: MacB_PCD: FtsX [Gemmataceae bacterium]|nr:abc transporter atp-binding protein : Uncharacterized protein OS=Pirellula staleyi (strain ATCC 27377 / DSM 6068 / ICPB 4128) GN=Psta_2963 PE=4 SV=1: MacB_PCD: FtsX [Gemmataceae bacterium]VTU01843.1 abc transporter atp-binding protein : Uncharacterized protein OS=Pirellula staleyi (strain ATCC 27377 / DSM 6068 / ICPB 4128) GN=Psta_2963 PE=4 SV=1: MacB_PCD: FtsX [Gemmataceae bacterium]
MYGLPIDGMTPTGLDPSMFLLSGYLLGLLGGLNLLAIGLGVVTLPVFFVVLFSVEQVARVASNVTGWFPAKLVLYMFRGLRRSPLRTSLTYIALFVLTLVLSMIYSVLVFIGRVTTEKEADFKAIATHKTIIPSQMPRAHYEEFKRQLAKLPDGMRPKNGDADIMAWSFFLGTTDPISKRPDNNVFAFCIEPKKILTMMDGLDELTGKEKTDLDAAVAEMERDPQAIVMSRMRLKKMNLQIGQTIKVTGLNYADLVFDLRIIGELPDGKYDNISFINSAYLFRQLDAWKLNNPKNRTSAPHPMDDKCINLLWVRLPNKAAFEQLAAAVNDTGNFSNPQIKIETASSGFGTFLEAFKDILWGMKYLMAPAMVAIMCLVIANAISIGVRERRTEMAVLKVLGFQPRHVLFLVVGEAVLVGLMAGFMSTLIAFKMIGNLKLQIAFFGAFFVPAEVLLYGPLLGAFVSVAGSVLPAMNAKNVKVAEVFAKVA